MRQFERIPTTINIDQALQIINHSKMVNTAFMIVDRLTKRTPKSGDPYFTGSVITKEAPSQIKNINVSEPAGLGEIISAMQEDQFALLTNIIISNHSLRTTKETTVRIFPS